MLENSILETWRVRKFSEINFYLLEESISVSFEHSRQLGGRSSYAYVEFACQPVSVLEFRSSADWDSEWSEKFENAIVESLVDSLITTFYPYCGCIVDLVAVKSDLVNSSEHSFYDATAGAMKVLVADGKW